MAAATRLSLRRACAIDGLPLHRARRSSSSTPLQPDQRRERLGQDEPARGDLLPGPRALVSHRAQRNPDPHGADELPLDRTFRRRRAASGRVGCALQPRRHRGAIGRRPDRQPGGAGDASFRCRPSTRRSTGWSRRARRSGAGTWTGVCSTWNHASSSTGAATSARFEQRNAALKAGQARTRWSEPGIRSSLEAGASLAACVAGVLSLSLQPHVAARRRAPAGPDDVELSLSDGWSAGAELADALEHPGHGTGSGALTHVGPHRADLVDPVRRRRWPGIGCRAGSRNCWPPRCCSGTAAMRRRDWAVRTAALLVDDPAAELDEANLERLISAMSRAAGAAVRDGPGPVHRRRFGACRWPEGSTWNTARSPVCYNSAFL